ncbi:hypothetical protein Taro_045586 [Colocasia esculenta]|uniref:Uncharacterized protein n=1 Tax=Colocasia esculenta TaxID=4460 RepID=A0A843WWY5_COLES|nr:hypothetical protein [Colocasia esculenta]
MRGGGPCVVSRHRGACIERGGGVHFDEKGPPGFGSSFESHVVVLGVGPQLGQAAVLCALCVSVAALSHPSTGAEAEARLASRACRLRVPLLAASDCGLVAVVVTTFSSRRFQVFLVARACTVVIAWLCLVCAGIVGLALGRHVLLVVPASVFSRFRGPILGCQPMMAPACVASRPGGVSGVRGGSACEPSTFRVPAALAGEALVIPTGPCSRGSPPYFLQLGARCRGSSVSDGLQRWMWHRVVVSSSESERYLRIRGWRRDPRDPWRGFGRSGRYSGVQLPCMIRARVACCSCCCVACMASVVAQRVRAVAARLALDSLAMVFLVWRTLAIQFRVVACGTSGRCSCLVGCPSVVGVCAVVVVCLALYACALCSGRRAEQAEVHRLVALCSGEVSQNRLLLFCALVVLVEVLLGPACVASAVLLAAVFSLMCAVWLGRVLVRFSLDGSWRFLVEVLPKAASCVSIALLCTDFLVGLLVQALFRCWGRRGLLRSFRLAVLGVWLSHRVLVLEHFGFVPSGALVHCVVPWLRVFRLWDTCASLSLVVVFSLACGASVCDCGTLLRSGSLGGRHVALNLCGCFASRVVVRGVDVFHASVAVCHVVEHVTSNFCGSTCIWYPCRTTRKVWVRPSGDSGCRFCVLRVLRVRLLSLLDRKEVGLVTGASCCSWREASELLADVSCVAVGNCVICRVLLTTERVADLLVLTARSVGGYGRVVFGWLFLLFGPNLASLGSSGVVVSCGWSEPLVPGLVLSECWRMLCAEHCFRFVLDSVGLCGSRVCATALVGGHGIVLFSSTA